MTSSWLRDGVLLDSSCPLPLDRPFTPAQARAWGVSSAQLRGLLRTRLVRRVVQGVYAAAQAPDDPRFRARALSLVVSESAVVTDRTAAWLHGVDVLPRTAGGAVPVSIFQRPGTRSRRDGVLSGERALAARDIVEVEGVAVTAPLRTACDLGRLLWRFDALAALDAFLGVGVVHHELLREVDRFKGYRGVVQLRSLAPLADARAESPAESALRLHWYDAGLPRPEPQVWVHDRYGVPVYRLDLALPRVRFAAEYDGEEFHTSAAARQHDAERREWLDAHAGWVVATFTKTDVYGMRADPGPRLREGLLAARARLAAGPAYPSLR